MCFQGQEQVVCCSCFAKNLVETIELFSLWARVVSRYHRPLVPKGFTNYDQIGLKFLNKLSLVVLTYPSKDFMNEMYVTGELIIILFFK